LRLARNLRDRIFAGGGALFAGIYQDRKTSGRVTFKACAHSRDPCDTGAIALSNSCSDLLRDRVLRRVWKFGIARNGIGGKLLSETCFLLLDGCSRRDQVSLAIHPCPRSIADAINPDRRPAGHPRRPVFFAILSPPHPTPNPSPPGLVGETSARR